MLLATSLRAGCKVFFSEDMQHNHNYDGIIVLNPFKLSSGELDPFLS